MVIRFRFRLVGGHVHVRVFTAAVAKNMSRGGKVDDRIRRSADAVADPVRLPGSWVSTPRNAGDLVFSTEEWPTVVDILHSVVDFAPEER